MAMLRSIIIVLCAMLPGLSTADTIRIGFSQKKPPYVMRNGGGLEVDIVEAALAHTGHTLSPLYFEKKYLPQAMQQERIDAMGNVHEKIVNDVYHYSTPYVYYENYAISHLASECAISSITDLSPYRIVAWQGAHGHLGPEFEQLFNPQTEHFNTNYLEHHDQIAQNRMFWQKRMEIIIVDKLIFEWHRRQLKKSIPTHTEVVYHDIFERPTRFKIGFRSKQLRDDFNKGLAHLKKTGQYKKMFQYYYKGIQ